MSGLLAAVFQGGPRDQEVVSLNDQQRHGVRIPIPPESKVHFVSDGPALALTDDVEIEVGEYLPTDRYVDDYAGRTLRIYRWLGPDRYFMCNRSGCFRWRQKLAWHRRCQVCHERTIPYRS